MEAERLFKQALKAGESCYRRSQQLQHHGTQYEAQHSKYNPLRIDPANNQNNILFLLTIAHLLSQWQLLLKCQIAARELIIL